MQQFDEEDCFQNLGKDYSLGTGPREYQTESAAASHINIYENSTNGTISGGYDSKDKNNETVKDKYNDRNKDEDEDKIKPSDVKNNYNFDYDFAIASSSSSSSSLASSVSSASSSSVHIRRDNSKKQGKSLVQGKRNPEDEDDALNGYTIGFSLDIQSPSPTPEPPSHSQSLQSAFMDLASPSSSVSSTGIRSPIKSIFNRYSL